MILLTFFDTPNQKSLIWRFQFAVPEHSPHPVGLGGLVVENERNFVTYRSYLNTGVYIDHRNLLVPDELIFSYELQKDSQTDLPGEDQKRHYDTTFVPLRDIKEYTECNYLNSPTTVYTFDLSTG